MKNTSLFQVTLTILLIFGATTVVYLYANGYRLERKNGKSIDLTQTGMVGAKSIPEGANVYLDGILLTATNDTIAGIEPGTRHLKIIKKGFVPWEKDIEVFKEVVTDITAVLVTQSSRLEPLTNTGARSPTTSPSLSRLAYFSDDSEEPGIMVISLGGNFGFLRNGPTITLEDTKFIKYSTGKSMEWSPDERKLLVETETGRYFIVDLETKTSEITSSPEKTKEIWKEYLKEKRERVTNKLDLSDELRTISLSENALWAPDGKKFLITVPNGSNLDYKIYNLEDPLPVGEKRETTVLSINSYDSQPKVSWYSDSFHLLLLEGDVATNKQAKISLIRIDGTNKTEIFNNTLYSDSVYSSPGGDKIIILTSFKSGDQTDLYTVSIR